MEPPNMKSTTSSKKKSATSLASAAGTSVGGSNKKQKKSEVEPSISTTNPPPPAVTPRSSSKHALSDSQTTSKKQKRVSIVDSLPSTISRKSVSDERLRAAQQLAQLSMSDPNPLPQNDEFLEQNDNNNMPWGSLLFYESKKLVKTQELTGSQPIKITAQVLMGLQQADSNNNDDYTDWQHVIGPGFTLCKRQNDDGIVFLQRLEDDSNKNNTNKLKVFQKNKIQMEILDNDTSAQQIFSREQSLSFKKDLDSVRNVKQAYELTDACCIGIVVIGQFMEAMGPVFLNSIDKMMQSKEMVSSMPYWFMLKLNNEFMAIDNKMHTLLLSASNSNTSIKKK